MLVRAGTAPAQIEVDAYQRQLLEQRLRESEAHGTISSCPLAANHYQVGERYLVLFSDTGDEFGWAGLVYHIVDNETVELLPDGPWLAISKPLLDAYLPGAEAQLVIPAGSSPYGEIWSITGSVPLNGLLQAISAARSAPEPPTPAPEAVETATPAPEATPTSAPPPIATPSSGTIQPPEHGRRRAQGPRHLAGLNTPVEYPWSCDEQALSRNGRWSELYSGYENRDFASR